MRPTWSALGQTVAITIASMLGLGILGLPVSLYATGLNPFFMLFTITFVAQIFLVCLIVELLQRSVLLSTVSSPSSSSPPAPSTPLSPLTAASPADGCYDNITSTVNSSSDDFVAPSMFTMADHFIPNHHLHTFFNLLVYMHFILLLVTYALAAPQSYVALIPALSAVPFSAVCGLCFAVSAVIVWMAYERLLPLLSLATLLKAALLVALVAVTMSRGLAIQRHSVSSWAPETLLDPFLVGTFALGGTIHTMPVTLELCLRSVSNKPGLPALVRFDATFFVAYGVAVALGLLICYVLNVVWCVAVLLVVPQDAAAAAAAAVSATRSASGQIPPNSTLANANANGEISTVPLIDVLNATNDPSNHAVVFIVNSFIAISITISIFIMLVALLHFLEGSVKSPSSSSLESPAVNTSTSNGKDNELDPLRTQTQNTDQESLSVESNNDGINEVSNDQRVSKRAKALLWRYFISIAVILVTALLNQKAIYKIMEGVLTCVSNLESGCFMIYMFILSRREGTLPASLVPVPAKLAKLPARLFIAIDSIFYGLVVLTDLLFYIPTHVFSR